MGLLHYWVNKPLLPQGQAVHERLGALGVSPRDLDHVVLTHLHDDHASGLALVKEAKRILVSDTELRVAISSMMMYERKFWSDIELQSFAFDRQLEPEMSLGLVSNYHDLFGDGSLLLINTPGHTQGMASVLLRGEQGYVILCADAAYSRYAIDHNLLPGIVTDVRMAQKTMGWLRYHIQATHCLGVIANHDPLQLPGMIEI